MSAQNLSMFRGDDFSFDGVVNVSGAPMNLTGATLRFTAKYSPYDPDGSAIFTLSSPGSGIVINSPTAGTFTVSIAAANTLSLPAHTIYASYDLQVYDSTLKTFTVLNGTLVIKPDISITRP